MKNSITNIVFDHGEVIWNGFYGMHERLSRLLGTTITNEQLQTEELQQFFLGEIKEETMWTLMIRRFKWQVHRHELQSLVRQGFTEVPGTLAIVDRLANFHLSILSNHGEEWVDFIRNNSNFHDSFQDEYYSYETGYCKPDVYAFENMMHELGVNPFEILFIDDSAANIEVASHLGMRTHRFSDARNLQFELEEMGLI